MQCIKIENYKWFTDFGNILTSIIMLHIYGNILAFLRKKHDFRVI